MSQRRYRVVPFIWYCLEDIPFYLPVVVRPWLTLKMSESFLFLLTAAGMNNFQHSGNIPISQQTPTQMPTPYHQFTQPQPQHHQNPTVQYQHHQPHQQSHQQHPHSQQHTTPPLSHTPQGQNQGNVMQQPQPAHGGRPSPSPVNPAAMHQANQQVCSGFIPVASMSPPTRTLYHKGSTSRLHPAACTVLVPCNRGRKKMLFMLCW